MHICSCVGSSVERPLHLGVRTYPSWVRHCEEGERTANERYGKRASGERESNWQGLSDGRFTKVDGVANNTWWQFATFIIYQGYLSIKKLSSNAQCNHCKWKLQICKLIGIEKKLTTYWSVGCAAGINFFGLFRSCLCSEAAWPPPSKGRDAAIQLPESREDGGV